MPPSSMAGKAHRRPAGDAKAARRQRVYRARLRSGQVSLPVLVGPEVLRALEARGLVSEAELDDRTRVADACASVLREWARLAIRDA
jgi:hypothetical protein